LDAQNEAMVQSSIDELLGAAGATAVVVAHRLSTVKNANKIVVVERGKIVQIGSHEGLLKEEGGRYEALVKTQLIGTSNRRRSKPASNGNGQEHDGEEDVVSGDD
jgi:ABC-type multidrug transport system fused ATPase/permease subunit